MAYLPEICSTNNKILDFKVCPLVPGGVKSDCPG